MELHRSAGVLLHPTSLPGPHGIGELGAAARRFVDLLAAAGQKWWQVLPLNPPDYLGSPYSATSSMAGNSTLIDLEALAAHELLKPSEIAELSESRDPTRVDYQSIIDEKDALLRIAFERDDAVTDAIHAYEASQPWLDDWALFAALRRTHGGDWRRWPRGVVRRDEAALGQARAGLNDEIRYQKWLQCVFDRQWFELRDFALSKGVQIIGDIPIFVAMDSADVWANREIFKVDADGTAEVVAGVPPDYFSPTGQKWGNPVFRWDAVVDNDYAWWERRIDRACQLCDIVRIDHFRGFESYWEVPAEAPTAETGEWKPGPGAPFFEWVRATFEEVPFIAEDLGIITEAVEELRDEQGLPGMKVLQFAFDGNPDHPFLPHNYPTHCVAYTGTHDNDTTQGWWDSADDTTRHNVRTYLSHPDEGIVWALIGSMLASDAGLAIVPFQDLYELGSEARMNTPGTSSGNWSWRMRPERLQDERPWERLGKLTDLYDR